MNKEPRYTGIVISDKSRNALLSAFSKYLPEGWKMVAHHMTIDPFKVGADERTGQEVQLKVTEFGISPDAAAVKVSGYDRETNNKFPHITVAIPPNGKAKNSNDITKWVKLKEPIYLSGTIENI